jgi:hypothetical protein
MNEYIQFEDVLASPVTGIQGVARESRSEEAGRRGSGKHRLATSSHRQAVGFRPFRGIAVVVSTAALAVAAFAVTTSHGAAPSPARAQATISTTLNPTSPVAVAAKYVKSLDPSMKLSTDQLAKLITELRARVRNGGPARPLILEPHLLVRALGCRYDSWPKCRRRCGTPPNHGSDWRRYSMGNCRRRHGHYRYGVLLGLLRVLCHDSAPRRYLPLLNRN